MARTRAAAQKRDKRHEIIRLYREAHENKPAQLLDMAAWAYDQGLWRPRSVDPVKQLAEELSHAMREEYFTDPKGRRARVNHAVTTEDGEVLWADMRNKSPRTRQHVGVALQQRRQQIVRDCLQLKTDQDVYNDNFNAGQPIQTSFNFEYDLAELELLREEDAA